MSKLQDVSFPKETGINRLMIAGGCMIRQKWIPVTLLLMGLVILAGCTTSSTTNIPPPVTTLSSTPATSIAISPVTTVPATIVTTIPPTIITTTPNPTHSQESGEKPSVKILETNPAGTEALVNVEFTNPTDEDLTMTAIVQVTYQYGGGMSGAQQGRSSSSGMARADVSAHDKRMTTVEVILGGYGDAYVNGMATLSNFQYTKMVKNKAVSE
jgi:hypothetical protein